MTGNPLFAIIATVAIAIFAFGVVANIMFWLSGRSLLPEEKRRPNVDGGSPWRSLVLDGLFQRRLWRLSRLRWLMKIGFIWGTAELFFVGSLGDMLSEKGILPIGKDTPLFAALNEIGTVLVFLGVGVALYRRFIAREVLLPTSPGDTFTVVLLATTVLSGLLVEAARLLTDSVPASIGWYSFVGYFVAHLIRPLSSDWSAVLAPAWWTHMVLAFSLVAYLPYGKLFHMLVSPLVLAVGAKER
ncbi:MAG: respiratory nitrate reductase subunit gamma [Dehalococcoidia bacterium]|nr:respiratory nitrate reductase subunit gamma [Dehalococcoidia bacterium]